MKSQNGRSTCWMRQLFTYQHKHIILGMQFTHIKKAFIYRGRFRNIIFRCITPDTARSGTQNVQTCGLPVMNWVTQYIMTSLLLYRRSTSDMPFLETHYLNPAYIFFIAVDILRQDY